MNSSPFTRMKPAGGWSHVDMRATGSRLFLYLVVSLFPLALIAIVATLQSARGADRERQVLLRIAATESTRAIGLELIGDMAILRAAAESFAQANGREVQCARVSAYFASLVREGGRFGIVDAGGRALCGEAIAPALPERAELRGGRIATRIVQDAGIFLAAAPPSASSGIVAKLYRPASQLGAAGRPSGEIPPYALTLQLRGQSLLLAGGQSAPLLSRHEVVTLPLAIPDLSVELRVSREPVSASAMVALLTPLLMWIAGALAAWLVVDRLLLKPLKELRTRMAAYRPGERFRLADGDFGEAIELRDLAQVFASVTRVVATHEAGLARGLEQQTKLTREVHHRVKNNLQIIASLISLHARDARGQEAQRAYSSIQRRVDALAVVHRHHFAEMEATRGVPLRAVLGELTSNIRAGTAATQPGLAIPLAAEPLYVTQDIAIAVSFMATELIELALLSGPAGRIAVSLTAIDVPDRALLRVESAGLKPSARLDRRLEGSVGRVLEGLSRQLRAPLSRDVEAGSYAIVLPFVGRD